MVSRRHAVIEYRGQPVLHARLQLVERLAGERRPRERAQPARRRPGGDRHRAPALPRRPESRDRRRQGGAAPLGAAASSARPARRSTARGDLFCRQCGGAGRAARRRRRSAPSCGTAVPLPARFCNACGGIAQPRRGRPARDALARATARPTRAERRDRAAPGLAPAASRAPVTLRPQSRPTSWRLPPAPDARPRRPSACRRSAPARWRASGRGCWPASWTWLWWPRCRRCCSRRVLLLVGARAAVGRAVRRPRAVARRCIPLALRPGRRLLHLFWGVRGATPGKQPARAASRGRGRQRPPGLLAARCCACSATCSRPACSASASC